MGVGPFPSTVIRCVKTEMTTCPDYHYTFTDLLISRLPKDIILKIYLIIIYV